jgi:uroporphyrinogen-III decarboxylase
MNYTPRQRFLNYVRKPKENRQVVSPFLPHFSVIRAALKYLELPITDDNIKNEILLSRELDYEPMFMTDLSSLIFHWKEDESLSDENNIVSIISTSKGNWFRKTPRKDIQWCEESGCPVQTEEDHKKLVMVCQHVHEQEKTIRKYFKVSREKVGEDGVIVIGHPHPSWLGYQISPQNIYYQYADMHNTFVKSMSAVYEASLFVMSIAVEEGIDFMSDSCYGLEMTSPKLFEEMDLPYIQAFSKWTHERNGLFWYHNCGQTRQLIIDGYFNKLGADLIETIAPPPEGDNDLAESRRYIDPNICTKGNLNLLLLRDGKPKQIIEQTEKIASAVKGYKHVLSTADAVLDGTPPENFIAFVKTAREMTL